MRKFVLCASVAVLLLQTNAYSWSGGGHQVIAAEAYRQLSPELKAKVTDILKAHPDYGKWTNSFSQESTNLDLATFVFMRCSTWADEIRGNDNPYDHPHWHYTNYPLRPPSYPMEPGPSPTDDILFGLQQCEKFLSDPKTSAEERAVYLSFLIHYTGDIHMPLHSVSLFNAAYPNGDKGGNSIFVKPGDRGIALHSFWDQLLGTSGKPQTHLNYAIEIQTEQPRESLKELKTAKTPKDWSLESRNVAIDKAYLHGELKGSTDRETAPELPEGYTKAAKTAAEKQGALAGYRLADEIRKYVK